MSTLNTHSDVVKPQPGRYTSSGPDPCGGRRSHPPAPTHGRPRTARAVASGAGRPNAEPPPLRVASFPPWRSSQRSALGRPTEARPRSLPATRLAVEEPARAGEVGRGSRPVGPPGAARPPSGGRPAEGGAVGRAARPLGRIANNVSGPGKDAAVAIAPQISERYRLADGLRTLTPGRPAHCRRKRCSEGGVQIQLGPEGQVRLSGLVTCASVWGCPVCAAAIYARRTDEVVQACEWARGNGLQVYMVTLTVRHHKGQALSDVYDGLSDSWRRYWQGRAGKDLKSILGLQGYIRGAEVTHGKHGWHPHMHCLLFVDHELSERELDVVRNRWLALAPGTLEGVGAHVKRCKGTGVDEYLTKLGLEVAGIITKEKTSNTPWAIARRAAEGDLEAAHLWREYYLATKGRRQLTWSRGLKARAGVREASDAEAADPELPQVVATIDVPPRTWDTLCRIYCVSDLLDDLCRRRGEGFVYTVVDRANGRHGSIRDGPTQTLDRRV